MAGNSNLHAANRAKNDEFYTQLEDIEKELKHYREHFNGKTVFCNCDDPYESNFFKYFAMNFNALGLKKLIATCYNGSPVQGNELLLQFDLDAPDEPRKVAHKIEITEVKDANGDGAVDLSDVRYLLQNDKNVISILKGNGDFRSPECVELLKEADIVVTNPPFSLFREYVAQLVKYDKTFLIIGNQNAFTYKEIFKLIKENKLWLGFNMVKEFLQPKTLTKKKFGNICWFTNIDIQKRHEDLILYKSYNPEEYPKYDNYDAINVNKTADIPCDYDGVMGVPITFLDKFNPEQFEIITLGIGEDNFKPTKFYKPFRNAETGKPSSDKRDFLLYIKDEKGKYLTSDGYRVTKCYARVLIRKKQ